MLFDFRYIKLKLNGKLKATFLMSINISNVLIIDAAKEVMSNYINIKDIVKIVYIPWKLINIITKSRRISK